MSYINDALRKAQKEKESGYVAYERIVSAPSKRLEQPSKQISIIGLTIVAFFASGMIALLYWLDYKNLPAKTPLKTAPLANVIPLEMKAFNKTSLVNIGVPGTKTENVDLKKLYAQALKKQKEGDLEKARYLYRKILKINPKDIQTLNNLGVIHMKNKDYKKAIMRFNDAIAIKNDYTDAHYNLACLYAQKNDAPQSLFYLKNAIRFNPEAKNWAKNDMDLRVLANIPEFKELLEN